MALIGDEELKAPLHNPAVSLRTALLWLGSTPLLGKCLTCDSLISPIRDMWYGTSRMRLMAVEEAFWTRAWHVLAAQRTIDAFFNGSSSIKSPDMWSQSSSLSHQQFYHTPAWRQSTFGPATSQASPIACSSPSSTSSTKSFLGTSFPA